jgi:hypothetical protein
MVFKRAYEVMGKVKELHELIDRIHKGLAAEEQRLRDAHVLYKILTRMVEGNTAKNDISMFGQSLPVHGPQWKVRHHGARKKYTFLIRFVPVEEFKHLAGELDVNMSLLPRRLEPYALASGRGAKELKKGPNTALNVLTWMSEKEDALTMAYGRKARKEKGR